MADVHNTATRRRNMQAIKGRDTRPEMLVRRWLHAQGYRYRLYVKSLPGRPDIVLPKYKTILFIHGCFWHGHPGCRYFVLPKTRTAFWQAKIAATRAKDAAARQALEHAGWKVLEIWECVLKPDARETTWGWLAYQLPKIF